MVHQKKKILLADGVFDVVEHGFERRPAFLMNLYFIDGFLYLKRPGPDHPRANFIPQILLYSLRKIEVHVWLNRGYPYWLDIDGHKLRSLEVNPFVDVEVGLLAEQSSKQEAFVYDDALCGWTDGGCGVGKRELGVGCLHA